MTSFQPTQSETIVLNSDVEQVELEFRIKPKSLIVQVRDNNGVIKNVKLVNETIMPNGKTLLKEGDTITYIAVM